jgi:SNF2 family DNA or RNA helicase
MIRRLKANVLSELPAKRRHTILIDPDPEFVENIQKDLHIALQLSSLSFFLCPFVVVLLLL